MKSFRNDDLIGLLSNELADLRMLSLHLLCEGYAIDPHIYEVVVRGWDQWGVEHAFPEFPMLAYFPVPAEAIEECCHRAGRMVEERKLINPITRCAGKLIEQLMTLPPPELEQHVSLIESTVSKSKIFFRVDVDGLRDRLELMAKPPDELAGILNEAVGLLANRADDRQATLIGLRALEALRIQHPDYLELGNVLQLSPPASGGSQAASFQLTLHSLIQFEQTGLADRLAPHLSDSRESIYTNTVEALVRLGNAEAANAFVEALPSCELTNQRWIARGLQRIRVFGLADRIAHLRETVLDPALWLMLLIAEVRQFDPSSAGRIASDLRRLQSYSETLIDSLTLYARLNQEAEEARTFQQSFMDYIQRSNHALGKRIAEQQAAEQPDGEVTSAPWWQETILRYRDQR